MLLIVKYHYHSDKQGLEKKIEDVNKKMRNTSEWVRKTDYNANGTDFENKIPSITGLVNTATLNTKVIENKIPDIINLAIKAALLWRKSISVVFGKYFKRYYNW